MATAEIDVPTEALPTLEQANDDISRPIYAPSWRFYLLLHGLRQWAQQTVH